MQTQVKRDKSGEQRFYFGARAGLSLEQMGFPGYTKAEVNAMLAEYNAKLNAGRIDAIYRRMRGAS